MIKIIEICFDNNIPFFTTFQFGENDFCNSYNREKSHPILDHYVAMSQCKLNNGVNVDKYIFWLKKIAKEFGHSSIHLKLLGIDEKPKGN
jgi:hypothetical protein